jgi:energy-coupling factor transport system ATP-binding protein
MVRFERVSYRYPGADSYALRNVDLDLEPGEVTFVTGPLGAGCSTLLLVIADLAPRALGGHLDGSATILGAPPGKLGDRSQLAGRVGLLLPTPWTQLSGMSFSVRGDIAFGPSNLGRDRGWIEERVEREIERLGIGHLAQRDPTRLSGGELQKVMMASVLAMDPEILLLDEPAVELDPRAAAAVYGMLPDLARERTVVVAATDIDGLREVAGNVIALREGEVVGRGRPDRVLREPAAVVSGITTSVGQAFHAAGVYDVPLTVAEASRRYSG